MKKISIIDYNVGNIRSIINAVSLFEVNASLTDNHEEIINSDAIILPGVGSYRHGMYNLKKKKLDEVIHKFAATNKPIMGICLGMQLMMANSEEHGHTSGLGLFEGEVKKIPAIDDFPVPHIGWEEVEFTGSEEKTNLFFCHSYVAIPKNKENILAIAKHPSYNFCAAVRKNNIIGYQFHPEKSGPNGIELIKLFIKSI